MQKEVYNSRLPLPDRATVQVEVQRWAGNRAVRRSRDQGPNGLPPAAIMHENQHTGTQTSVRPGHCAAKCDFRGGALSYKTVVLKLGWVPAVLPAM